MFRSTGGGWIAILASSYSIHLRRPTKARTKREIIYIYFIILGEVVTFFICSNGFLFFIYSRRVDGPLPCKAVMRKKSTAENLGAFKHYKSHLMMKSQQIFFCVGGLRDFVLLPLSPVRPVFFCYSHFYVLLKHQLMIR